MSDTDPIRIIRASWAVARQDRDGFSRKFYSELFRIAPETEVLFKSDLAEQGAKLMATLDFVVDHLDEGDALLPAARDLAIRHTTYGVKPEDYAPVGQALVATLQSRVPGFDASGVEAWVGTYAGLSDFMIESAYSGAA